MSELPEFQARQIVKRMGWARNEVENFAAHARMLTESSSSIDGLVLLQQADELLKNLKASRVEFENANAQVQSLSRTLSSRPPNTGGLAPAAKWGSEFRAGSRQFTLSVQNAERQLRRLYGAANAQLNSPTRVSTPPDNLLDVLLTFTDALSRWIEYKRRKKN